MHTSYLCHAMLRDHVKGKGSKRYFTYNTLSSNLNSSPWLPIHVAESTLSHLHEW